MLLETIFASLQSDERILVCTLDPVERRLVHTVQEALAFSGNHPDKSVYYGVAPRDPQDIDKPTRLTCIWGDFDLKDYGGSPQALQLGIQAFVIPPTFEVNSGHGVHAYWLLTEDAFPDDGQRVMKIIVDLTGAGACHDPTRLMRIPGSTNWKDPAVPIPVTLQTHRQNVAFPLEDLERLTKVTDKIRRLIQDSSLHGYKSRSERDFAVMGELFKLRVSFESLVTIFENCPVGDKYRDDGGAGYLRRSWKKLQTGAGHSNQGFIELDDCYLYPSKDGLRKVSTFVFKPKRLLRSLEDAGEDSLLGDIRAVGKAWPDVTLKKAAFSSVSQMLRTLPTAEWMWYGSDVEVRKLLPYLVSQLNGSHPPAFATTVVGRHNSYWVAPGITFDADRVYIPAEAPYVLVKTGRETPPVRYTFPDKQAYESLVKSISDLLPRVNEPGVITPTIGWFMATPLKPVFEEAGIRFPSLNIFGTRGAGKSSTILYIMQPLLGYADPRAYTCKTTRFVVLSLFSSTNALPISFTEYRQARMAAPHGDDFMNYVLMAYDTGFDARGNQDQSTTAYPLSAPFTIDGEDSMSDPAAKERTVGVNMHPAAISGDDAAFNTLRALSLQDFAGRYIQSTLREDATSLSKRHAKAVEFTGKMKYAQMPNRVRNNLAVTLVGLDLYNEYMASWGASGITYDTTVFDEVIENTLIAAGSGRTRMLVDDFVERVINAVDAFRTGLTPPFYYSYDEIDNCLWFHFTSAYAWWADGRRRTGQLVLEREAIRTQLEERGRDYYRGEQWVTDSTDGRERHCVGAWVDGCIACQLDVPRTLGQKRFKMKRP